MSKTRKYYGIYVIYANNKIRLETAHNKTFKTKKEAAKAMKELPYPAMYTILEIYLNLKE